MNRTISKQRIQQHDGSTTLGIGRIAMLVAVVATASECNGKAAPDACLAPTTSSDAPVTHFGVHFLSGDTLLVPGAEVVTSQGAHLRPNKARFYVAQPVLVDEAGQRVTADLVDDNGTLLTYGVTLLDFEVPESMGLNLRAPAGHYRALDLTLGVPPQCASGEGLNHSDASAMLPPLDVDSDMYWSWNPGYVFLKFEGQVATGDRWDGFFYHVGDDKRLVTLELPLDFTIEPDGGEGPEVLADFDRLLTTPSGGVGPDVQDPDERGVHGGDLADVLAGNMRGSSFIRLAPAHR